MAPTLNTGGDNFLWIFLRTKVITFCTKPVLHACVLQCVIIKSININYTTHVDIVQQHVRHNTVQERQDAKYVQKWDGATTTMMPMKPI